MALAARCYKSVKLNCDVTCDVCVGEKCMHYADVKDSFYILQPLSFSSISTKVNSIEL